MASAIASDDTTYVDPDLLEIFGGEEKFLQLPVFDPDNTELGPLTDYIDFIKYDEVTAPIMRGIDKYRRTFIVFKFRFVQSDRVVKITEVLFQRYTNNSFWTSASNPPGIYSVMAASGFEAEHYERIKQVLTDGRINNIYNVYNDVHGDYILG